jgi:hypothetical protein
MDPAKLCSKALKQLSNHLLAPWNVSQLARKKSRFEKAVLLDINTFKVLYNFTIDVKNRTFRSLNEQYHFIAFFINFFDDCWRCPAHDQPHHAQAQL